MVFFRSVLLSKQWRLYLCKPIIRLLPAGAEKSAHSGHDHLLVCLFTDVDLFLWLVECSEWCSSVYGGQWLLVQVKRLGYHGFVHVEKAQAVPLLVLRSFGLLFSESKSTLEARVGHEMVSLIMMIMGRSILQGPLRIRLLLRTRELVSLR